MERVSNPFFWKSTNQISSGFAETDSKFDLRFFALPALTTAIRNPNSAEILQPSFFAASSTASETGNSDLHSIYVRITMEARTSIRTIRLFSDNVALSSEVL